MTEVLRRKTALEVGRALNQTSIRLVWNSFWAPE